MTRELRSLVLHLLVSAVIALVVFGGLAAAGLTMALPTLLAAGLAAGAAVWLLRLEPSRADQIDAPALDLDVDYALPHGQDIRVRRLEDMIHGAQPNRRMTARTLARTLAEIAQERALDPQAPPLSPPLQDLIDRARHEDPEAAPIHAIDRRTLHRHLRELADTGE